MRFFNKVSRLFQDNASSAPPVKPGRNEQCWCGSGAKYKKCHLEDDQRNESKYCAPSCGPT